MKTIDTDSFTTRAQIPTQSKESLRAFFNLRSVFFLRDLLIFPTTSGRTFPLLTPLSLTPPFSLTYFPPHHFQPLSADLQPAYSPPVNPTPPSPDDLPNTLNASHLITTPPPTSYTSTPNPTTHLAPTMLHPSPSPIATHLHPPLPPPHQSHTRLSQPCSTLPSELYPLTPHLTPLMHTASVLYYINALSPNLHPHQLPPLNPLPPFPSLHFIPPTPSPYSPHPHPLLPPHSPPPPPTPPPPPLPHPDFD